MKSKISKKARSIGRYATNIGLETIHDVEKITNRRIHQGKLQYCLKWRGYSHNYNTWEPEEHLVNCEPLIEAFEATQSTTEKDEKSREIASSKVVKRNYTYSTKRQDNGFAKGFEAESILGVSDKLGRLAFLIQFKGINQPELIPAKIVNVNCPQLVIKYYENRIAWYSNGDEDI